MDFAPERADELCSLHLLLSVLTNLLHLSVLMDFAPERAGKLCNFATAPARADEFGT